MSARRALTAVGRFGRRPASVRRGGEAGAAPVAEGGARALHRRAGPRVDLPPPRPPLRRRLRGPSRLAALRGSGRGGRPPRVAARPQSPLARVRIRPPRRHLHRHRRAARTVSGRDAGRAHALGRGGDRGFRARSGLLGSARVGGPAAFGGSRAARGWDRGRTRRRGPGRRRARDLPARGGAGGRRSRVGDRRHGRGVPDRGAVHDVQGSGIGGDLGRHQRRDPAHDPHDARRR